MMRLHSFLATAFLAAAIATPASAAMRITGDAGGLMGQYAAKFAAARESGEQIVIDGPCYSACTMLLGMVPRDRVCATRNAVLGFHAAWRPDADGRKVTSALATQALYDVYPSGVRRWIARRGGLKPQMIFLQGRELAAFVPSCDGGGQQTVRAQATGTIRPVTGRAEAAVRPAR